MTDPQAFARSGVPHGGLLVHFAECAVEVGPGAPAAPGGDPALADTRQRIRELLGDAALVDAAGVVAQFQRVDRIADATGIPLDASLDWATADLRTELGLDAFAASAHTPRPGPLKRALAGAVRRVLGLVLRLAERKAA